jgi:hypothetical protein
MHLHGRCAHLVCAAVVIISSPFLLCGELRFVSPVASFPRCQSLFATTGSNTSGSFTTDEDALRFWALPSLLDEAQAAHEPPLAGAARSVV